jgi:hypothetical protein
MTESDLRTLETWALAGPATPDLTREVRRLNAEVAKLSAALSSPAAPATTTVGVEPRGCPTPGACSCPSAAGERDAILEEAAKLVEENQEAHRSTGEGDWDYIAPRSHGNRIGLAYAAAIRGLKGRAGAAGEREVEGE